MALTDDLISYWKFDESSGNADDAVSTNDLTNNGTAVYGAAKINNGVTADTTGPQFMSKASPSGIPGGGAQGTDLSFSFWIKVNTTPAENSSDVLIGIWDANDGDNRSWLLQYTHFTGGAKALRFFSRDAGNNNFFTNQSQTLTEGTFYHIVGTFNAATAEKEVWVDGVSLGVTGTQGSNLRSSSADFTVGSDDGGTEYADAQFDELGIWDRVLTDGEIAELYNSGAGFQYPFVGGPFWQIVYS